MTTDESFSKSSPPTEVSKEQRDEAAPQKLSFPVVGIGASAGGLEAVSELLASLPAESGLALLLVQHLDPGHESLLTKILAKKTAMPVNKVTEDMVVDSNRLYVIPHNASMAIAGGLLRLQSRNPAQGQHMPIDVLFHSLAEDQGPNAIGVVLSGSGSDGALGIQEIKGAGGITFAQDEASARFSDMPRAAIRLGCVDFILAPAEIGRELVRIARHPYLNGAELIAEAAVLGEPALKKIFRLLWTTCGMDFRHYKRGTVQRCMVRRMALHKLDAIADYLILLETNPSEVKSLAEDLLMRAIVKSHGGRVEAKSPGLGQGSEFSVRLPLLPEAPTTLKVQPTPESLEQPSASRRILMVDDNQDLVNSLAILLQIWGHTVEIAYDASSALEAVRTFRPEIALLDIGLPGMTGLELAQQLRALPGLAGLYLVAVTGYGRKEDCQATLASGFHYHIVKPVDPEALKTLIASFEVTPEAGG